MPPMIERDSPVPYYEQLFDILRSQISDGSIAEDERLPSELELCREYGLSRATVRQTFSKLEAAGFARRVPRRGVFAAHPEEPSGWTLHEGFLESQLRHGRTGVKTTVVGAGTQKPPRRVAEALKVSVDTEVFTLERVRALEGTPAMFSTNWFAPDVADSVRNASAVLDGTASLNGALREAGHIVHTARRVLNALGAPEDVAGQIGVAPGDALLQVASLSLDAAGAPVEYYETWVLTEVIPLEVNVSAS